MWPFSLLGLGGGFRPQDEPTKARSAPSRPVPKRRATDAPSPRMSEATRGEGDMGGAADAMPSFSGPALKDIKLEMIESRRDGKYPAPQQLSSGYILVRSADNQFFEYVFPTFPSDTQSQPYLQYKSSFSADKVVVRGRTKVTPSELNDLFSRLTGATEADAPIEEAKQSFRDIVEVGVREKVSDIHFIVRKDTAIVLYRVYGEILRHRQYAPTVLSGMLSAIYNKTHDERSNSHSSFSPKLNSYCTITLADLNVKLRWQCIALGYDDSFDVVLRLIAKGQNSEPMTLPQLGYLDDQSKILDMIFRTPRGGVFIAGVTGSGKSKTLQTAMKIVASGGRKKNYSVEDPIEYPMYGVSQIMVQRNESTKINPFADVMKTLMRGDPDTIMAGEIRDRDSAQVAQDIIETGHHFLTTVHARSAIGIVSRLTSRDIGMSRETVAEPDFLSALIYQHLVPTLCPACKRKMIDTEVMRDEELIYHLFDSARYALNRESVYVRGDGCEACKKGVSGMTVCAEIIVPGRSYEMLDALRESRMADALRIYRSQRTARFDEPDCAGKTAVEVAIYKVSIGLLDPRDVQSLFGAFGLEEISTV